MSLAQKLIRKGENIGEIRGETQGKLKVAKELLMAGTNVVFIMKVTGLSLEQINSLK